MKRSLARCAPAALLIAVIATHLLHAQPAPWFPTRGPYGCFGVCLASADKVMYAGTSGGVYRSSDAGITWTAAGPGIPRVFVRALATGGNGLVYASLESNLFGVYRSTDSGSTWVRIDDKGIPAGYRPNEQGLALDSNTGMLFLGTTSGIFRRGAADTSWTRLSSYTDGRDFEIYRGDLYATSFGGMYRFAALSGYMPEALRDPLQGESTFGSSVAPNGVLLARAPSASGQGPIVVQSFDDGKSWSPVGVPSQEQVLFLGNGGVIAVSTFARDYFISIDGGLSWQPLPSGLDATVRDIAVVGPEEGWIACGPNGVIRSTDVTIPFSPSEQGINGRTIRSIAARDRMPLYGIATFDSFRSDDGGDTWENISVRSPVRFGTLALGGDRTLYGAQLDGGVVYRSTNQGVAWSATRADYTTGVYGLEASGTNVYFSAADNTVSHSSNSGVTFTRGAVAGSSPNLPASPYYIFALAVDSSGNLFAGSDSMIARSSDHGATWNLVTDHARARAIAVAPDGSIYAGHRGSVHRSIDTGATWNLVGISPSDLKITSIAVTDSGHVYVGSLLGPLHLSTDRGATWSRLTPDELRSGVTDLAIGDSGRVYVATYTAGIYGSKRFTEKPTEPPKEQEPPEEPPVDTTGTWRTRIVSVTPVPVTTSTTITYEIGNEGETSLEIFNDIGELVEVLVDGFRTTGVFTVRWDAAGVSSSVYFVRLRRGGDIVSVSALVMR